METASSTVRQWIGRTETASDTVTATPYAALSATLDWPPERPAVGTALPPLWHWLYFLPLHRLSDVGPDGHTKRGGFLPPVPLPRRMWAGSQVEFVLLFRYSALTFNSHRIHYDRRYVTEVEGYPGLVVHGPLIATLLLDLLRRELPDAFVAAYQFKAIRPLFDLNHFFVCGERRDEKTVRLWARDHEGWLAMDATAVVR